MIEPTKYELEALDEAISVALIFGGDAYDNLWNLRNRLSPFKPGDRHFDYELDGAGPDCDLCDDAAWNEHRGGGRPVVGDALIEVRHRVGSTALIVAGRANWEHGGFIAEIGGPAPEADIVAWRPVSLSRLNGAIEQWRMVR